MPNKFFAKKVRVNGEVYDSILEYERFLFLSNEEKEGRIQNLRRQVRYEIIPAQVVYLNRVGKNGQMLQPKKRVIEKAAHYTADFVYESIRKVQVNDKTVITKRTIIEDTKSEYTRKEQDYVLRRKLMRYSGNPIIEVTSPTQQTESL